MLDDFAIWLSTHVGVIPLSALAPLAIALTALALVRRAMAARDADLPDLSERLHALP